MRAAVSLATAARVGLAQQVPIGRMTGSTCYDGAWPMFNSGAEMENDPWGVYFKLVYGKLPYDEMFPYCIGDLWMLYDDLLEQAGVTFIPADVPECPPDLGDWGAPRYKKNNNYQLDIVSWIWHPKDQWWTQFAPLQSGAWVEVTHKRDPFADEAYGLWWLVAWGSGIWINLGTTELFDTHADACAEYGLEINDGDNYAFPGDLRLSRRARERGVNTIQFMSHADCGNYPIECGTDDQGICFGFNMEVLSTDLVGKHSCGTSEGSDLIRAGWWGDEECECDNNYESTMCIGFGSQQVPWIAENPDSYWAWPCLDGEEWVTVADERSIELGSVCAGQSWEDPPGQINCYQNQPDFYSAIPQVFHSASGPFCALGCDLQDGDGDCGLGGQVCVEASLGEGICLWPPTKQQVEVV